MPVPRLTLTVFMAVSLLTGCGPKKQEESAERSDARAENRPPADFAAMVGQGGGVTGLWQGYTMEAGGDVQAWEGRMAGENPKPAGRLGRDDRSRLWRLVQEKSFLSMEPGVPGNMTYFLEVTADAKTHRVQWSDATGAGNGADTVLVELRSAFLDAFATAASDKH